MGNLAFNNIVKIHDGSQSTRVINAFLNKKISPSTKGEYMRDIFQFFGVDSIEEITDKMIMNTDSLLCVEYFAMLDEIYASSTVCRKLSSLKALFNWINDCRVKSEDGKFLLDGHNPFNIVDISIVGNEYGSFTQDEVFRLIEVADNEFGIYFELLAKTSVRKEAIRGLNIDISFVDDQGMWCIRGEDKGTKGIRKKFKIAIGNELYGRCKELANRNEDGKVFKFSENTPLNKLKGINGKYENGYCYAIGISEEEYKDRNLCIHSFKKTGVQIVSKMSNGNLNKIMQQGKNGAKYAMETYQKSVYNPWDDSSNLIELREDGNKNELNDRLKNRSEYELREIILGLDKGIRDNILGMLVSEFGDIDSRISENGRVDHRLAEM